MKAYRLIAAVLVAVVAGCSAPSTTGTSTATKMPYDGSVLAGQVQTAILEAFPVDHHPASSFSDLCATPVVWACAVGRIESEKPGAVKVTLAPDAAWLPRWNEPEREIHAIGGRIARNVYNFGRTGPAKSLREVDVYRSTGQLLFLSPPTWPR